MFYWLIILAVFLIVGYYFILKSKSNTMNKFLSLLSIVFFLLTVSLFWSDKVIEISLYFPFVLGILGTVFGWFGIKGDLRISLIGLNLFALILYFFLFLAGTVGFQEP